MNPSFSGWVHVPFQLPAERDHSLYRCWEKNPRIGAYRSFSGFSRASVGGGETEIVGMARSEG